MWLSNYSPTSPALRGFLLPCRYFARWTNICSRPFMAMKAEFCQCSYGKNLANGASSRTPLAFLKPWQLLCQAYRRSTQGTAAFDRKLANLSTLLIRKISNERDPLSCQYIFLKKPHTVSLEWTGIKKMPHIANFLYAYYSSIWYNINIKRREIISNAMILMLNERKLVLQLSWYRLSLQLHKLAIYWYL